MEVEEAYSSSEVVGDSGMTGESDHSVAPILPWLSEPPSSSSLSSSLPLVQLEPLHFLRLNLSDSELSSCKGIPPKGSATSLLRKSSCMAPLSASVGFGRELAENFEDDSSPGWLILTLVLPYLDLRTLVCMESVSKGIRKAVLEDPRLWRVLEFVSHAERKINDNVLHRLVMRSRSLLTKTHVSFCLGLTGPGIVNALGNCLGLQELSLRSCRHVDGSDIVQLVKNLASQNLSCGKPPVLKSLRIAGCKDVTAEHVRELRGLLQAAARGREVNGGETLNSLVRGLPRDEASAEPPVYYTTVPESKDDRRLLDLDICPRCSRILEIYSCTRPECASGPREIAPYGQGAVPARRWPTCRACIFCIERCRECGGCCEDGTWTVCGCDVCEECWFNLEKCRHCNKGWCRRHAEDEDGDLVCVDCKDRSFRYMMTRFYDS